MKQIKENAYLIQDQVLDTLKRDPSSLHKVQESSRSSNENIATSVQSLELLVDTGPTVDVGDHEVRTTRELSGLIIDLSDELPGGGHDDDLGRGFGGVPASRVLPHQPVQHREEEGSSLPGS